jgi:hypothetical protein
LLDLVEMINRKIVYQSLFELIDLFAIDRILDLFTNTQKEWKRKEGLGSHHMREGKRKVLERWF